MTTPDWRHFLARRDGRAVGTATVHLTGQVAGIYFVMSLPSQRREGIGRAVMQEALQ